MRYSSMPVILFLLVMSFFANAAKDNIRIEIDETGKIGGITSYAFVDETEPENLPGAPRRREYFRTARAAIVEEMKSKGYALVEKQNANFLVEFSGMGIVVPRASTISANNYRGVPIPGTVSINTNVDSTQGMVRILVSLRGDDNHVWTATGVLDAGTGPKQNLRRINKLIHHIFKKFPNSTVE